MAITLNIDDNTTLPLEDYVDYVERWVDENDDDSLLASAPQLRALANNPGLLNQVLNRALSENDPEGAFLVRKEIQDTSFALARVGNLLVRANIWIPPAELPVSRKWQANAFTYLKAHDHNFSFLTVGYFGAGYTTHLYEYEREGVKGVPGEHVDLHFCERATLSQGKIMLYRRLKDVHVQEHPTDFSISVNLVAMRPSPEDQYMFDLNSGTIAKRARDYRLAQSMFCRLAGILGDDRSISLLEQNSVGNPYGEVRLAALEALASAEPSNASRVWAPALCDPDETVRETAIARMAAC